MILSLPREEALPRLNVFVFRRRTEGKKTKAKTVELLVAKKADPSIAYADVEHYELGYERCTCPKVLSGQITDPDQCNCSRHSILYILGRLEPSSDFEVEIIETVLRGAEHCRFRITKK